MAANSKRKDQAIKTYLRLKPIPNGQQCFLTTITNNSVIVKGQEQFTYDRIFDSNSTNKDIFQQIGYPLIKHSLQGYNACVLAYGQTSSGKTYTMKGLQNNQGIIPLTLHHLFSTIEQQKLVAEIRISYIEIYNQNIIDLLNSNENYLEIREDCKKNITISGLNQLKVSTMVQAMKLFEEGQSRRKFASNTLNMNSSRSHTIFRVNVEVVHEDFSKTSSCINMVDLAGSEGISRTKAEGNTKKQGENINKSILALSNVIRGMSQKLTYVNFRDSKLTRILQSSLCNNSRSVVICTVNPTLTNYQQTINTLKFGMYASQIKLQVRRNINQTGQKYMESEAKSTAHGQGLQPQERVQYQQNKRVISQLRQENQELRDYKRILNQKIQFLQLDNHRLLKQIENLQTNLKNKNFHTTSSFQFSNEEKQQYEKQIRLLKEQMDMMADKYEALSQYSSKLEKNQKYLANKVTRYESQISILKETAETKVQMNKIKTPIKPKPCFKPRQKNQDICPLTIGSIIILKAQIIQLKQNFYGLNEQIAGVIEERNQLLHQLQNMKDKQHKQNNQEESKHITQVHKKQIMNLHIRIKKLKNELQIGKNREKKLAKMLKACSETWIEEFDQFNEWYAQKRKRLDSIKKQKSGNKSGYKQNQNIQA